MAARLHAADNAAHLTHRGGDRNRCVLTGLDGAAVCRAEVNGELHLAVIYDVAECLAFADLLADAVGRGFAVRVGDRRKPAADGRGHGKTVQLVLRGNQRVLRLCDRILRLSDGALCLDHLFLCGFEFLARFGRVNGNEHLTGHDLVALADEHLRNLALDVAAELLALAGGCCAAALDKGFKRAACGDRCLYLGIACVCVLRAQEKECTRRGRNHDKTGRNCDAQLFVRFLLAVHLVCVAVALGCGRLFGRRCGRAPILCCFSRCVYCRRVDFLRCVLLQGCAGLLLALLFFIVHEKFLSILSFTVRCSASP